MINQKLLVSGADYFSDEFEINPYYTSNKIDVAKAVAEHKIIVDCFKKAGIEVIKVDPPKDSQDGVYTANWALVHNGVAVMARLPEARKAEEGYAKKVLENLGIKTVEVPDNYLYSGQGDSLICGNYLFGGRGYRSDPEAQQFAAKTLGLNLIQVHAKPQLNADGTEHINPFTHHADSFWYDLDLAISVIDEHTIAYCPDALDEESNRKIESLTDLDKITVDFDECTKGFANNLVSTGKHVIMSCKAPKFQAELEKRGLICLTPDIEELKEGGGYIRCVSLWLS
ncbi:amidinotransferase [Candidatus Saccharibacteria bacterium]|nr:amidinotransferase [Candidatus Saccharibacteria bacterium]